MKKPLLSIISGLLVLGTITSCASKQTKIEAEPLKFDVAVTETDTHFTFTTLPQVELMAIVCRLAELPGATNNYIGDNSYLSQIDTLFAKYKTSSVVLQAKTLAQKGIDLSGFLSLAYHIEPDFSGTTFSIKEIPDTLNNLWKEKATTSEISNFCKTFLEFASECNYSRIYDLNRSTYIAQQGYINSDLTKYKLAEWSKAFFSDGNIEPVTINVCNVVCGSLFYDYATDSNNKKQNYVTFSTGLGNYAVYVEDFLCIYTQDYANKNWDLVKDHYIEYIKAFAIRRMPDKADEIKKTKNEEYGSFVLASNLAAYLLPSYYKVGLIEDYPNIYEEMKQSLITEFADQNTEKVFAVLEEYEANRDTYKTIEDFYPKINELINSLIIPTTDIQ